MLSPSSRTGSRKLACEHDQIDKLAGPLPPSEAKPRSLTEKEAHSVVFFLCALTSYYYQVYLLLQHTVQKKKKACFVGEDNKFIYLGESKKTQDCNGRSSPSAPPTHQLHYRARKYSRDKKGDLYMVVPRCLIYTRQKGAKDKCYYR